MFELVAGDRFWSAEGEWVRRVYRVRVLDASYRPIVGGRATFSVLTGGGELEDSTSISNIEGIVELPAWRFGTAGTSQEVRVRVDSIETVLVGYSIADESLASGSQLLVARDEQLLDASDRSGSATPLAKFSSDQRIIAVSPHDHSVVLLNSTNDAVCTAQTWGSTPRCSELIDFGSFNSFAWSSNGRSLTFVGWQRIRCDQGYCYSSNSSMLQMDVLTNIITPFGTDWGPVRTVRWSPDGRSIAYTLGGALWTMNADRTAPRLIATSPKVAITDIRWSPDSRRLALQMYYVERCPWYCDTGLGVVNADGSDFKSLAQVSERNSQFIGSPVWEPDGRRIAFSVATWFASENTDTYLVPSSGGRIVRVFVQGTPLLWH